MISAHADPPAGGAALLELLYASLAAAVLAGALVLLARAHLAGRTQVVSRAGGLAERVLGLPAWAALPIVITGASLITAVFGFYWDVATHIDNGRDPGPFANPAHYFIIFGLLGIALAGYAGWLLGSDDDNPYAVGLPSGRRLPLGSLLLGICGLVAVLGFPLDDLWHRLFGQDVTLWGPTHLQMVGGAALSTLALWIAYVEGERAKGAQPTALGRMIEVAIAGAFLVGLSAFQGEFDYSVPQFRLVYHPILLGGAAALALVPARLRLGAGGAIKAVLFFLALRGILALMVGPWFGHTPLRFPLYLGAALAVEVVAKFVGTKKPLGFGLLAGSGVATLGLAVEWAWSGVMMTMSWPPNLLPEVIAIAVPVTIAAGGLGGLLARALCPPDEAPVKSEWTKGLALGAVLAMGLAYAYPIATDVEAEAVVRLEQAGSVETHATFEFRPSEVAEEPLWLNVTSWQGGGSRAIELAREGEGMYRTTEPVPITGNWKSLLRLHRGDAIVAVPIYMPEDPAIPAEEIPARAEVTRSFVSDKELLLREALPTPAWLSVIANIVLGLIVAMWISALVWGCMRLQPSPRRGTERTAMPISA